VVSDCVDVAWANAGASLADASSAALPVSFENC
jgi:hypothetical protein